MKIPIQTFISAVVALLLGGTARLHAVDVGPVEVSGTFSQGYINSDNNHYIQDSLDGTFDFREYGINAIWTVSHDVQASAQIYSREYGTVGNDEPYLDLAYLDYRPANVAGIRLGKMKIPKGLYNETLEVDALRTEILLPSAVYMELARELVSSVVGVGVYGDIDLAACGTLAYYAQYGRRGLDEEDGDFARLLRDFYFDLEDSDMGDSYSAKLEWTTPIKGLDVVTTYSAQSCDLIGTQDIGQYRAWLSGASEESLAASSFVIPTTLDIDLAQFWVLGAEYTIGKMVLASEWTRSSHDTMAVPSSGTPRDISADSRGYYVKADYNWSPGLYTAIGYSDYNDLTGNSSARDTYLSIRFDLTDNLILKFEEHFIDGSAGLSSAENRDQTYDDMTMFLAKATLYF